MIAPKRQLAKWQEPHRVAYELVNNWGEEGLIWLDGDGSNFGRWVILAANPIEQICCRGLPNNPISSNPFNALRHLGPGHWTGWLSYEAGAWLEKSNPWSKSDMSTLWISRHDPLFRFDLKKNELWIEGSDQNQIEEMHKWLQSLTTKNIQSQINDDQSNHIEQFISIDSWKWLTNKDEYINNVNQIKNLIQKGDIFQANLTTGCIAKLPQNSQSIDIYRKLKQLCPAPFSGVVVGSDQAKGEAVISASPERFMRILPTGEIETRPIKGTRPRDSNIIKDAELAAQLICSPKDRAENIMIVDILRNDLGRVCTPGTIKVPKIVELESYSQVHHLTSVIKGCLEEGKTWVDLFEASWPGGSITGAPKLRACQRLNEIEKAPRGAYCGSLLHIDWDGRVDSNIIIRSLLIKANTIQANAGCGIVADSDPDNEAEELHWKLIPLLKALE